MDEHVLIINSGDIRRANVLVDRFGRWRLISIYADARPLGVGAVFVVDDKLVSAFSDVVSVF